MENTELRRAAAEADCLLATLQQEVLRLRSEAQLARTDADVAQRTVEELAVR